MHGLVWWFVDFRDPTDTQCVTGQIAGSATGSLQRLGVLFPYTAHYISYPSLAPRPLLLGGIGSGEEWLMYVHQLEPSQCGQFCNAHAGNYLVRDPSTKAGHENTSESGLPFICQSVVRDAVGPQADGN